jgi:D-alanyl-D-alanine carboxypeptidase/D-alanyl-D-alanine-endopeptidase (penicillin-binding protein 4)
MRTRPTASAGLAALLALLVAVAGPAAHAADTLQGRVERAAARTVMKGATLAVAVADLESGRTLYERNAALAMIPASNQKLLTSVAALELLGADYFFTTTVGYTGELGEGGVLEGDLVVVGGGDPNLSGRFFDEDETFIMRHWASTIRKKGITRVTGSIVADCRFFEGQEVHPEWPENQLLKWYCAPVCAVSANDNCVRVVVSSGPRAGTPAPVRIEPDCGYIELEADCRTDGKRVIVRVDRDGRRLSVSGTIPAGVPKWETDVPVADPALFACSILKWALGGAGVLVAGAPRRLGREEEPGESHPLIIFRSDLKRTLGAMNVSSQNFYAEQILKTIGAEKAGEGSWAAGARAVTAWAERAELGRVAVSDGSGMSRENRLTARGIQRLLLHAHRARYARVVRDSLPVSGESGTLENRLDEPRLRGRVQAKTGYLWGVGALSGYARTASGREVAFSALVNGFRGGGAVKHVLDEVARAIIDTL